MLNNSDSTVNYRRLMGRYPTGVAVCLVNQAYPHDQAFGITVNSLVSISLDPLLLSFCAARDSRSAKHIVAAGRFSVNVLSDQQEAVSRNFAGQPHPSVQELLLRKGDYWYVADANASFFCELESTVALGDHDLLVGRILDMHGPAMADDPLMYFQGRYVKRDDRTLEMCSTGD